MIFLTYQALYSDISPTRIGVSQTLGVTPSRDGYSVTRSNDSTIVMAADRRSFQGGHVANYKKLSVTQDAINIAYMPNWDEAIESMATKQIVTIDAGIMPRSLGKEFQAVYTDTSETDSRFACGHYTRTLNFDILEEAEQNEFVISDVQNNTPYGWNGYGVNTHLVSVTATFEYDGTDKNMVFNYISDAGPNDFFVSINGGHDEIIAPSATVNGKIYRMPVSTHREGTNYIRWTQRNIGATWAIRNVRTF